MASSQEPLVKIGAVVGAHGIKGYVKIRSFAEFPEDLTKYPLSFAGDSTPLKIKFRSTNKDVLIAKINGVEDRNQAEAIRGKELFVPREKLPKINANQVYHADLIGLEVRDLTGNTFGKIDGIYNFGAGDIIEITEAKTKKAKMYPFNNMVIPEINLPAGYVTINPPDEV